MVSVNVNEPDAPAVTVTDGPVVDPMIVPFPVMVQLCVTTAPAGETVEVYVFPVELQGTGLGPVMVQVGLGLTGTVKEHEPGHPSRVMLSVSVNEPAPLPVTLTEEPSVAPLIVPLPVMDQLCVTVPPAGRTVEV
jgi:hypothetical protein